MGFGLLERKSLGFRKVLIFSDKEKILTVEGFLFFFSCLFAAIPFIPDGRFGCNLLSLD